MVEFRAKRKEFNVQLGVIVEKQDGTEDKRILEFDCSPENYTFVTSVMEAGEKLEKSGLTGKTAEEFKLLYEMEKETFELMAPGKFVEYFEFFNQDITDMMYLIKLMIETISNKGIEYKQKQIAPVIPEDAVEV